MADFLLELLCEEIPARMQPKAKEDLARLFTEALAKAGLVAESVEAFATPRRLALIAKGLPLATEAVSEETKGPKVGAPPQALEGFLRKVGLTADQLVERDGVYFAVVEKPGRDTAEVLAEAVPAIIRAFPWPKSMRWGAASITTESLRWVRPLSGIIALLDGAVVPFAVDGIASGRTTMGHRFHHSGPVAIADAGSYVETLRAAHVIVHFSERCALIREGAAKAAAAAGLTLVADEGLVIENAGLTEWPVPLLGRFDETFLDVPPEVIQLTARVNQKYFVCEGEGGKLANAFICTANIAPRDAAVVVDGNRKVLAARLSDARFFWEQDQKTPLAVHAEKLARITFHEKLGTVADKVERVAKLARWLCEEGIVTSPPFPSGEGPGMGGGTSRPSSTHPQPLPSREGASLADLAEQAARLCKADLVTEMVGEFPELQGLMGGYYARAEGLPDEVADAIRDHYKPVGQGDEVPTAPVTVAVSLADKLDTLVGFFAIDEKPTGSKDPFALRRAALSIIELIILSNVRVSFRELIAESYRLHALGLIERHPSVAADPLDKEFTSQILSQGVLVNGPAYLARSLEIWALNGEPTVGPAEFDDASNPMWDPHQLRKMGQVRFEFVGFVDLVNSVNEYIFERLRERSRRAGVRPDLIDALMPKGVRIDNRKIKIELPGLEPSRRHLIRKFFYFPNAQSDDDAAKVAVLAAALQAFITTDDGANLLAGYKRAANILKKENYRVTPAQAGAQNEGVELASGLRRNDDVAALSYTPEPAEAALIDALDAAAPRAAEAVEQEQFADAMAALATLRSPIDRFFDEVTVNAPDAEKRAARLALLARFRDAVHRVADFSRIEG